MRAARARALRYRRSEIPRDRTVTSHGFAAVAILSVALALNAGCPVHADEGTSAGAREPVLEEVLVTGVQPGPGLWKVTRPSVNGDHVLWILGLQGPLPKKMTWRSTDLEAAIARSQELLAPPSVSADIGFFGGLAMLPSLVGVRDNPDGKKLQDILPADLYARWLTLKVKYLGHDEQVEKWRPIFAAGELYMKAISKSGLESSTSVWAAVEKLAKKHRLKVTKPEVTVKVEKARAAIKEFKRAPLPDLECFAKTIERLESDLDLMRARANAWATGNVGALREMTHFDQASACIAVVQNAQVVQERGYADIPARMAAAWLAAAQEALERNESTVAVLWMYQILVPDGYLAQLRSRGYTVEEP